MENFNIYNFLLNKNKDLIDLVNYTLKVFDVNDSSNIKRSKLKLLKKHNKNLTPYWNNESYFRNYFLKKSNYYNANRFKGSQQQDNIVVGARINNLDIECNNNAPTEKPEIKYIFKNFGVDKNSLLYIVNFDEKNRKAHEELIIINNITGKANVVPNESYAFMPAMHAAMGITNFNNVKNIDMKYIESVLNDNNIELLKLLLGQNEYKDSLKNICEMEHLKNDSNMFEKFINHEKIFGVLDLNNFVCVKNEE